MKKYLTNLFIYAILQSERGRQPPKTKNTYINAMYGNRDKSRSADQKGRRSESLLDKVA